MSRIIVIGGSGHIGAYLIPALMEQGHNVVNVSRGQSRKYRPHSAWRSVEQITVDRTAKEKSGVFGSCIAGLRPDIVIDLISFDLPNFELETLHHVHADDVAQFVIRAIANKSAAAGETFNVVSEKALHLRGYAEAMYRWFGFEPKIRFQPFDDWKIGQTPEQAQQAWEHIVRSSCVSMEKARHRLGYQPRYTSLAAIQEAVSAWILVGDVQPPKG